MVEYEEEINPEIDSFIHDINAKYEIPLDRRIFTFAVSIIKLIQKFPKSPELEVLRYQLIKSAKSIGANFEKARAGIIPEFTGISAPYEEPLNPELAD